MNEQIKRDQKLIDLVTTMEDVYSFVDAIESVPSKIQLLEDIITKILKQTVECSIFIREYTGHGFGGEYVIFARIYVRTDLACRQSGDTDPFRHQSGRR